ncbi:hypothetical protein OG244_14990 [Streptomyces brevispora]|uniref:hypothetical protein n=1 Tax=Streptomyces brevispora TaxID=887462 RepID=UPI002E305A76|nr:hypothetical protein [Streptomyces brevispora]
MTHIEGTARPPVPVFRDAGGTLRDEKAGSSEVWPRQSRLTNWLKATAAGTGLLCGFAAAYLGVTEQTAAAIAVGGVACAAFAALGGITMTMTINIRK